MALRLTVALTVAAIATTASVAEAQSYVDGVRAGEAAARAEAGSIGWAAGVGALVGGTAGALAVSFDGDGSSSLPHVAWSVGVTAGTILQVVSIQNDDDAPDFGLSGSADYRAGYEAGWRSTHRSHRTWLVVLQGLSFLTAYGLGAVAANR